MQIDMAEWLAQSEASAQTRTLAIEITEKVKRAIDPSGHWAGRLRRLGAAI